MNKTPDNDLPTPDFPADAFDRWVRNQTPPGPSPAFLDRCLATIPNITVPNITDSSVTVPNATVPATETVRDTRDTWRFVEALAVAALVWINLSMSAALSTDYGFRQNAVVESSESNKSIETVESVAERIQGLVPEFSAEESHRHAILMRASASLVCLPDLAPMLPGSKDTVRN
jgi:hypothetical protein